MEQTTIRHTVFDITNQKAVTHCAGGLIITGLGFFTGKLTLYSEILSKKQQHITFFTYYGEESILKKTIQLQRKRRETTK
jgi:hypothetical protein